MCKLADTLEALAEKATPGPLTAINGSVGKDTRHQSCCGMASYECCGNPIVAGEYFKVAEMSDDDAAMFAALVNNLPAIITALRDVERMREALQAIDRHNDNPKRYDSYINDQVRDALEPVEAVARAIAKGWQDDFDSLDFTARERFMEDARAAILALSQNVSDEMIDAGNAASAACDQGYTERSRRAGE